MRKYFLLVVLMFGLASCKGCEKYDGQANLEARWEPHRFPLRFIRSDALPQALHEGAETATMFWNRKVGHIVIHAFVVADASYELVAPPIGTIAFSNMPVGRPDAHGFGWRWAPHGNMHSFELRLPRNVANPARAIAHELGHALGLGEGSDPELLMNVEANPLQLDPDQWQLGTRELQAVRDQVFGL